MKTNKIIVYVLISLIFFTLFINAESWATSRTYPIKQVPQTWECSWICETYNDVTCCYRYCSEDNGFTWYQLDKFCFADPIPNLPQK